MPVRPADGNRGDRRDMKFLKVKGGRFAKVSDKDFSKVSKFKWHLIKRKYVSRVEVRRGKAIRIYLHRLVKGARRGEEVHHKNGNGLDCQRRNLKRLSPKTHRQTFWPSKKTFRGVGRRADTGRWRAYIQVNRKHINLGCFSSAAAAAKAYNIAARRLWGKHAHQNAL